MREIHLINDGWQFWQQKKEGEGADVILPHSVELTPANSSGGRNYQGKCHYIRKFPAMKNVVGKSPSTIELTSAEGKPLSAIEYHEDKKYFLRFDGAMGVAQVFFNGKLIAENDCGYLPFVAEVTEEMQQGGEVEVILDNSDNLQVPPGKPQDLLDFSYEGGIYRNVWLISTQRLFITDSLLEEEVAGGGILIHYSEVSRESCMLHVNVHTRNETGKEQKVCVRVSLLDEDKKTAAWAETWLSIESKGAAYAKLETKVEKPKLWSAETPNLYMLKTEVICDGTVVDSVITTTGIRDFTMTYDNGVIYNGKSVRISGGNYHQSWPIIGNAVPDGLLRRDVRMLRELGMKNIRAHYPLADAFTDACNRLGITLIVSNPGWQHFQEGIFTERLLKNMRKIIRWQRNNPCILLWEPMPNESVVPMEVQQMLHDAVHEEFPFSPCYTASDHGPTDVSYREYDPGMLQPGMEGYTPLKRYGGREDCPVWVREYGDSPDNWDDQGCAWRTPRGWGDDAQLRAAERLIGQDAQLKGGTYLSNYNKPNICGFGVWPAIEHNRGYHVNPCWGGFYDLFRIPKFTAWLIKSQQDLEEAGPVIFIANWWTEVSPKDVTVFSNAQRIRLYYDDKLVEEREPESIAIPHPPFVFREVYQRFRLRDRGTLRAEAIVNGKTVAVHQVMSPGAPRFLKLEADQCGEKPYAGGDILAVHCSVLDEDGNITPRTADNHPVYFQVEGEGEIIGDSSIGANPVYPEAGIASILIRTKQNKGEIRVSAEMMWPQKNSRIQIQPAKLSFFSS